MSAGDGSADREPEDGRDPEEELRELLADLMSGGGIDPSRLAGVAGLPSDPNALAAMMQQMQRAMMSSADELDWKVVEDAAHRATGSNAQVTPVQSERYTRAFTVGELWLSEATRLDAPVTARAATRHEWLSQTMPTWTEISDPVATSISNALVSMLTEQSPEELRSMLAQSTPMVRSMGRAMFAMQLGSVLGKLASEVLSGGDIGVPLLPAGRALLIPENLEAWGAGLELEDEELALYFAVRELAHARLFQQAKWLRLHLVNSIAEFASGIRIDGEHLESVVRDLDVQDPEQIRRVLESGELIPPRTEQQSLALERLETTLALVEGWVDVVTEAATTRLPHAGAIAEMVRRRRASGSPAEHAFGALVGLELRPRRLREATQMWRAVTEAHGTETRDRLWDHRDAVPTAADIDDPAALVDRLSHPEAAPDELDSDLQRLLDDPESFGDAPEGNAPVDKPGD